MTKGHKKMNVDGIRVDLEGQGHRSKVRVTMLTVMDGQCTGHRQHLLANVAYIVYFIA